MLRIIGLPAGRYMLSIDGEKAGTATAEELSSGYNMALLGEGPIARQAKAVQEAVFAKNRYYHDQIFRGVVLSQANVPEWLGIKMDGAAIEARRKAVIEDRAAKMPELDAAVRRALKVRPHTVEIAPVGN